MKKKLLWASLPAAVMLLGLSSQGLAQAVGPDCNRPDVVGGGTNDMVSPDSGAGWDVGSGQCNGDFTVTDAPDFAKRYKSDGDGLELGMRIEQRSAGQVQRLNDNEYLVQTGPDTTQPNDARAWWNFQHSIAYDGAIDNMDHLTFVIRTDEGPSIPVPPTDMLAIRNLIDARNDSAGTATYLDLYQTSQNPVFGWFEDETYDFNDEGAWTMVLGAVEGYRLSSVTICVHMDGTECGPAPVVYHCEARGFERLERRLNRTQFGFFPGRTPQLRLRCRDGDGNIMTDADIAAPYLKVVNTTTGEIVTDGEDPFTFNRRQWKLPVPSELFDEDGIYEVSVVDGGSDALIGGPNVLVAIASEAEEVIEEAETAGDETDGTETEETTEVEETTEEPETTGDGEAAEDEETATEEEATEVEETAEEASEEAETTGDGEAADEEETATEEEASTEVEETAEEASEEAETSGGEEASEEDSTEGEEDAESEESTQGPESAEEQLSFLAELLRLWNY